MLAAPLKHPKGGRKSVLVRVGSKLPIPCDMEWKILFHLNDRRGHI